MRPTRFYSNRQEKSVAHAVGGKQTANSGATKFLKGDVTSDDWLFECKTKISDSKSITVQRDWIIKNREEAFAMGKDFSAVVISFGDGTNHYIIDERTFKLLWEAYSDAQRQQN